MKRIIRNAIQCNNCGDIIESQYRHDYVQCKCGECAVDGGHDHLRRCYVRGSKGFKDLSENNRNQISNNRRKQSEHLTCSDKSHPLLDQYTNISYNQVPTIAT